MEATKEKTPDGILSYSFNWLPWLNSDTISSSSWELDSGITEESSSNTATATTIQISGGDEGEEYEAKNTVVTANSDTETRILTLKIVEK